MRYGRFERTFVLPDNASTEELTARLSDGMLEIRVPVAGKPAPRKIEVNVESADDGAQKAA